MTAAPGEVEAFLYREARLLDQRRYRDWRALFAQEFLYWVPSGDPQADPEQNCTIIYAGPQALDDRLERAESSFYWAGDPAIHTVHALSNLLARDHDAGGVEVESCLVLYLYRVGDQRRTQPLDILPALCTHRLVRAGDDWRISYKKVAFLQADGMMPLLPPVF